MADQVEDSLFENNSAQGFGGAVYHAAPSQSSGLVSQSHFVGNSSANGGALAHAGGSLLVQDAFFSSNDAGVGGAVLTAGEEMEILHSTLTGNTAQMDGGAIYVVKGALQVVESSVLENEATEFGGGLYVARYMESAEVTVLRSTFAHNEADQGGALFNVVVSPGSTTIENSTFSQNTSTSGGGAIQNMDWAGSGLLRVRYTTFAWNGGDAAIWNEGDVTEFANSIVAYSTGQDCFNTGAWSSGGNNMDGDMSCPGFSHGGVDPELDSLQFNGGPTETHALLATSPAIDAASGGCTPTDQRGVSRPQGGACDLGSYERIQ